VCSTKHAQDPLHLKCWLCRVRQRRRQSIPCYIRIMDIGNSRAPGLLAQETELSAEGAGSLFSLSLHNSAPQVQCTGRRSTCEPQKMGRSLYCPHGCAFRLAAVAQRRLVLEQRAAQTGPYYWESKIPMHSVVPMTSGPPACEDV
jgi:hypothetical protein